MTGVCSRIVRVALFAGFPLAALLGIAVAEPLSDGINAYGRKDYATAKRILRPLAERGSTIAQFYLGLSCEPYMWFTVSAHDPDFEPGTRRNLDEVARQPRPGADRRGEEPSAALPADRVCRLQPSATSCAS